ncbi:MAG: VCBS repeat-containing protein [Nannocystaceae bacterium]|nr:VCBS repeat-containing protein [Nannocystaceae bacterium]
MAFSEFDVVIALGLGVYEGTELRRPEAYRSPIDAINEVLGTDLDGDGRDEALVLDWSEGVLVRFDAEGVPCQSPAEIDAGGVLLDIDGDGRMEFAQPGADGITIMSAP